MKFPISDVSICNGNKKYLIGTFNFLHGLLHSSVFKFPLPLLTQIQEQNKNKTQTNKQKSKSKNKTKQKQKQNMRLFVSALQSKNAVCALQIIAKILQK